MRVCHRRTESGRFSPYLPRRPTPYHLQDCILLFADAYVMRTTLYCLEITLHGSKAMRLVKVGATSTQPHTAVPAWPVARACAGVGGERGGGAARVFASRSPAGARARGRAQSSSRSPAGARARGRAQSSSPTTPSTPRLRMTPMSLLSACSARLRISSRVASASAIMFSGS